ncbi:MAG TPA: YfhO family protein, partial [Candidatus Limnocylindria bacterium]|nr:YfhO family protein [Candidatus Limnocylindria bacterium]
LAYPTIHFQRESFWRGEIPMWNPYSNSGAPFLAQWGTMVLYPFSLIYLLLPLPWSLSLFCFAHVWLGGIGMYLLARHWTKTNLGGALAGTTYVFNGIMFASFVWPNYLITLGWMPFVVLLAERAWREGGRWTVGCALVSALQMLSGAPEIILFTWLIIALLWLCDVVRAPAAALRALGRMLIVVLLTSGLMAVQLMPFFELLKHSHRDLSFVTAKWQLPLWGWANFIVPLYNAFQTQTGQFYQYDQGFLSSVYIGGIALAFALVAVFRWPDARVWILCALGLLSLFLAFGEQTPVFGTLRKALPFLGIARYPVKFLFVLAFVVPLLAGCGMAALFQSRRRAALYLPAILVLAAMLLIMWAARGHRFVDVSAWPENFRQNIDFGWSITMPGDTWPDAVANSIARVLLFVLTVGLFLLALRGKLFAPLFALAALILIVVDVRTHTPDQSPSLPSELFVQHYWPEDLAKPRLGAGRVMIVPEAEDLLTFFSSTNAQHGWEIKRRAEWSNLNLLDSVAKVNGSSTLQTVEQRQVEKALYSMTNRLPASLLDFLGVTYITSSNSAAHWTERPSALPWVTAGQAAIFADDAEALATITNSVFDPRQTVVLPPSARSVAGAASNAVNAKVSAVVFTPRSIEAEIETPAPTLLVIAQSYYPAWKATVDDANAPLLRANLAFQAVPVPAGRHRVRVVYIDTKFRVGALVSGCSLLLCGLVWLRSGKSRD